MNVVIINDIIELIKSVFSSKKETTDNKKNGFDFLNHFYQHYWGQILSWWGCLKPWLKERILYFKEIVLLDAREDGGRELIEAIEYARPNSATIDDIDNGPVAVSVSKDNTIAQIDCHEAQVQQRDQYDAMQAENNGILRING